MIFLFVLGTGQWHMSAGSFITTRHIPGKTAGKQLQEVMVNNVTSSTQLFPQATLAELLNGEIAKFWLKFSLRNQYFSISTWKCRKYVGVFQKALFWKTFIEGHTKNSELTVASENHCCKTDWQLTCFLKNWCL